MKLALRGHAGFSIIELVLAAGLMGIIALGMVSMFESQNKQVKVLNQKQESVDLKNILLHNLSKSTVCTWQFTGKTVNTSGPPTSAAPSPTVITLPTLYMGPNAASAIIAQSAGPSGPVSLPGTQTAMRSTAVQLNSIFATGNPNEYQGTLEIQLDQASLAMPLKNIQMPVIFRTTGPAGAADSIVSCYGVDSSSAFGTYSGLLPVDTDVNAATDGFVIMQVSADPANRTQWVQGMVDGVVINSGGTHDFAVEASPGSQSFTMAVPRGHVWRVHMLGGNPAYVNVRWLPVGQ